MLDTHHQHHHHRGEIRAGKSSTATMSTDLTGTKTADPTVIKHSPTDTPERSAALPAAHHSHASTRAPRQQRHRVQEFNDVISCHLCRGYLINATTIDNCVHSYCRSCIVQYLQSDNHCPQCKPHGKHISLANLRSDEVMRTVVYKLVPGLYQQERERVQQFTVKHEDPLEGVAASDPDEDYFFPAEPISLSLEYHPAMLVTCKKAKIPPVRYLQCPAGVTVHHLKRFLCSKYDIDPDNERVEIEVIYEEEVLPENFSLMDVGYCYNWKRVAPMKFTYRILVHSEHHHQQKTHQQTSEKEKVVKVLEDINMDKGEPASSSSVAKRVKKSHGRQTEEKPSSIGTTHKTVRFIDRGCSGGDMTSPACPPLVTDSESIQHQQLPPHTVLRDKSQDATAAVVLNNNNNNNNINNNNRNDNNNARNKLDLKGDESLLNDGNGPVKVIIARKQTEGKKHSPKRPHSDDTATYHIANDFKSLRSNDIRYSDYTVTSTTGGGGASNNKTLTFVKQKSPSSQSEVVSSPHSHAATNQVSKCDIVVSIPQSQVQRSPHSSEESFENITLAQLKTAAKKSTTTNTSTTSSTTAPTTTSSTSTSTNNTINPPRIKNVPKLKIELNRINPKISTIPPKTKSAEVRSSSKTETKKAAKIRKFSFEEPSPPPTADDIDLETYVKNIGLKPIDVVVPPVLTPEASLKPKFSPDASPMSSESSSTGSSSSNGTFPFTCTSTEAPLDLPSSSSSHKKRKKKHSREPKDSNGKRRKLHAEISSQPADESLKMKVKITASHTHRPHKFEIRKPPSCSSDEVTITSASTESVPVIPRPLPLPVPPTVNGSDSSVAKLRTQKVTNHNMATLNRTLSEESSNITNLMNQTASSSSSSSVAKKTEAAPPPPPVKKSSPPATPAPQVMTTIHSAVVITPLNSNDRPAIVANSSVAPVTQVVKSSTVPKPIAKIRDLAVPASPPLPPSLFKTMPLTIPTITTPATTSAAKPNSLPSMPSNSSSQRMPMKSTSITTQQPVAQRPAVPKPTPTPAASRQSHFVVPNPPRSMPSSPKHCSTPSSIASSVNRDAAAQLKRSASLDESNAPMTLSKQQRMEQDRLIRRTAYGAFSSTSSATQTTTQRGGGTSQSNKLSSPATSTGSYVSKAFSKPSEKPFYSSPMSSAYTHEVAKRKLTTMILPPASVSVTKMTEMAPEDSKTQHKTSSTGATLTITSQKLAQRQSSLPFAHQQLLNKPALEIVRITPSQSSDQTQAPPIPLPTPKSSPPKATRPPPPPIPLVKVKNSANQTSSIVTSPTKRSPTLSLSTPVQSAPIKNTTSQSHPTPPALISMRTIIPAIVASKSASAAAENVPKQPDRPAETTCTTSKSTMSNGKPISSRPPTTNTNTNTTTTTATHLLAKSRSALRDYRPSSKDGSVEILDLSSAKIPPQSAPHANKPSVQSTAAATAASAGNSLEAALNKIKQNITSNTVSDSIASSAHRAAPPNTSNDDLQNLHLLSESATSREKIAIRTLPKLNEISKVRGPNNNNNNNNNGPQSSVVRHQNASVRNIPNPSALAFRNQQAMPTLATITKTPSTQKNSPAPPSTQSSDLKTTTKTNVSASATNPSSARTMKKNMKIDQVAANLNIRAAAAADRTSEAAAAVKLEAELRTVPTSKASNVAVPLVTSSTAVSSSCAPTLVTTKTSSHQQKPTTTVVKPAVSSSVPKTSFKSISSLVAPLTSSSASSSSTSKLIGSV